MTLNVRDVAIGAVAGATLVGLMWAASGAPPDSQIQAISDSAASPRPPTATPTPDNSQQPGMSEEEIERIRLEAQAEEERRATEAAQREAARVARGEWRSSTRRSEIDDSSNIFLTVTADRDVLPGTWQAARPSLEIRCMENTTAVVIDVGAYVGIDETQITLRIDNQNPETRSIGISTNYEAVGLWNGGAAIPYIQRMFGAEKLTVRITPYGENAQIFAFPVKGLENVIGPLREECGW